MPLVGRAQHTEPVCVRVDSEPQREYPSHADPAPDPAKSCLVCGLFHGERVTGCGDCMIMSGPVTGTVYCESWSERYG